MKKIVPPVVQIAGAARAWTADFQLFRLTLLPTEIQHRHVVLGQTREGISSTRRVTISGVTVRTYLTSTLQRLCHISEIHALVPRIGNSRVHTSPLHKASHTRHLVVRTLVVHMAVL